MSSSEQNSGPSSTSTDAGSPVETGDDFESAGSVPSTTASDADWEQLGGELIEMAKLDQEERADFGDSDLEPFNDEPRTGRLIEIVDRYGWPTPQLAGEDANRAAFLLAQHSDSDPAFQDRVLSLIQTTADYAGRGEQEALLTDRIAANSGAPQLFGSQIRCVDGEPIPYPALDQPDRVDDLRSGAGLEPLSSYLVRFDQHCTDVALIPQNAGCDPIAGVGRVIEPNAVVLVGELHGTAESPEFVGKLVCTALSHGYGVTVGLEFPDDDSVAVDTFLNSNGRTEAREALLAVPFWSGQVKDGRQSNAMLELIEEFRQHTADGAPLNVVLLDAYGVDDRDAAMAERLLDSITAETDGVAITLTGNLHNRTVRGFDFDPDYEPMGYLVEQALGTRRVRSLDIRYSGGQAWTCSQDGDCGPRAFDAPTNGEGPPTAVLPIVEVGPDSGAVGFNGYYFVGELTPSSPAVDN